MGGIARYIHCYWTEQANNANEECCSFRQCFQSLKKKIIFIYSIVFVLIPVAAELVLRKF